MKLKAYVREEEEKTITLSMKKTEEGDILVYVADFYGEPIDEGNLLEISSAGVFLVPCVSPDLGFPLDCAGKLKIIG